MKIRILPQDTKFSIWIKQRDNWKCQRCLKQYDENAGNSLQNSHFWSRRNWTTRFDPDNCDAMCFGCHALIEGDKQGWYRDFKIKQLGKSGYDKLQKKAQTTGKKRTELEKFNNWYKQHGEDFL